MTLPLNTGIRGIHVSECHINPTQLVWVGYINITPLAERVLPPLTPSTSVNGEWGKSLILYSLPSLYLYIPQSASPVTVIAIDRNAKDIATRIEELELER